MADRGVSQLAIPSITPPWSAAILDCQKGVRLEVSGKLRCLNTIKHYIGILKSKINYIILCCLNNLFCCVVFLGCRRSGVLGVENLEHLVSGFDEESCVPGENFCSLNLSESVRVLTWTNIFHATVLKVSYNLRYCWKAEAVHFAHQPVFVWHAYFFPAAKGLTGCIKSLHNTRILRFTYG